MGRFVCVVVIATLASINCVSAESVYLTANDRLEKFGLGEGYTFLAPYFTAVKTTLWISITKAAVTNQQNQQNPTGGGSQSKAVAPTIYDAEWVQTTDATGKKIGQIRYAVSCDLSSVLHKGGSISVSDIKPTNLYSGDKTVASVSPDSVFVDADATKPDPPTGPVNGTLSPPSCPQAASAPAAPSLSITFGVTTTPTARAYLYWLRNAFFSDSVNIGLDGNGMLSLSDSSSTQQITSILTELGQTIGQAAFGLGGRFGLEVAAVAPPTNRQRCFSAITNLLKAGPYYVNYGYKSAWPPPDPHDFDPGVSLEFKLEPLASPTGAQGYDHAAEMVDVKGRHRIIRWRNGLVAFYPVPAKATLACIINNNKHDPVYLSAPSIINLYTARQFVDPQRDFLTGPQDTFTFNAGFIVGHKYGNQSSAKTIVDTITAPIRAMIPSVSVTQSTTMQSTGASSNTTSTTTSAPKSQ